MAFAEPYTLSAVSVGASELSIVTGTTVLSTGVATDGVYLLVLDPVAAALAKGDEYIIRFYEKCLTGSTKRVLCDWTISDAQTHLWMSASVTLLHGWDMTLQKIAGTDRNWTASIRQIA